MAKCKVKASKKEGTTKKNTHTHSPFMSEECVCALSLCCFSLVPVSLNATCFFWLYPFFCKHHTLPRTALVGSEEYVQTESFWYTLFLRFCAHLSYCVREEMFVSFKLLTVRRWCELLVWRISAPFTTVDTPLVGRTP